MRERSLVAICFAVLVSGCSLSAQDEDAATCRPGEELSGDACVSAALAGAWLEPLSSADLLEEDGKAFTRSRLLVGLKDDTTSLTVAEALLGPFGGVIDGGVPGLGFYRVRFAEAESLTALDAKAAAVAALPEVDFAIRNEAFEGTGTLTSERPKDSDDEKITGQALAYACAAPDPKFTALGAGGLWAYESIGVYAAWDAIYKANPPLSRVVVGVVDGPVEPKIFGSLPLVGYSDFQWIASGGQDTTIDSHGTLVAAPIGAPNDENGMNGILSGLACISYDLSPQGVQGKWLTGTKNSTVASIDSIIVGMARAIVHGARVVNLSLGLPFYLDAQADHRRIATKIFSKVMDKAPGVLFVTGAGNDGKDASMFVPAAASTTTPNLLTVGAVDSSNAPSVWAAHSTNTGAAVLLAAPGTNVLTTDPNGSLSLCEGTSLAAPLVSGVAGLLFALDSKLTGAQARQVLLRTADAIAAPSVSGLRLNAAKAVADVIATIPPDRLGKGTCRPPDPEPPPGAKEPACPIGDDYCYYCSGPSAGPVDFAVPGAKVDYPRAYIEIGWASVSGLSNFEISIRDLGSGAFLETGATNIKTATPGTGNTNVVSLETTRNVVTLVLGMSSQDSAHGAGSFGVDGVADEKIKTVTFVMTFSGEIAEISVDATSWSGAKATAKFTGVYQLSDSCPL